MLRREVGKSSFTGCCGKPCTGPLGFLEAKLSPLAWSLPTDFGFAQHMCPWAEKHVLRGSPLYMAPEMVCQRQYDARVDLWSVGVILYGEYTVSPGLESPIHPCTHPCSPIWAGQALTLAPPSCPLLPSTEALFGQPPFASRSFLELEEKIRSNRIIEVSRPRWAASGVLREQGPCF